MLRRKIRALGALAVIEGERDDPYDEEIWHRMDLVVLEMITDSVTQQLRTKIEDKSAKQAYDLIKEKYTSVVVVSFCRADKKFFSHRQLAKQSLHDYTSRFDTLRTQFESAEGTVSAESEITVYVLNLQPHFSKEAYMELNRQKRTLNMGSLRQALESFSEIEKDEHKKREIRTERRHKMPRAQISSEKPAVAASHSRPTCNHCQKMHLTENCWLLFPDKRPPRFEGDVSLPKDSNRENDQRNKAYSAVSADTQTEE